MRRLHRLSGLIQAFAIGGMVAIGGAPSAGALGIVWSNTFADTIGEANADGTGVNQSFIKSAGQPRGVAIEGNYIYWANGNSIGRANLDGTGVNQNFIMGVG